MSNLRILGKDTVIYGFGQVLKKIIGIILLPFYTRALSPDQYGILDTLSTLTFFIAIILAFGMDGATSRYFYIAHNDNEKQKILYTSVVIRFFSNVFPIIFLLLFSNEISDLLFQTRDYTWVVVIVLLTIPVYNISKLQESIFRYYRVPWKYLVISVTRAIVNPVSGILLVVILQWGVFGATLASLISSSIILIVAFFYYTKRKYTTKFSWYWAKKMLHFGYPLIFTGILLWVNNVSDRFFLLHYADLSQIGLYSIGNTFAQPILLINMALTMSSTVLVMSLYSEEEKDKDKPKTKAFLTKIWFTYLAIAGTVSVCISVFSFEIVQFVTTQDYIGSILALPFLLFSHILYQGAQLTGNGMTLEEQSKPYVWIMLLAGGFNILLNFYFVPRFGYVGAAVTTIISNFIYFIVAYTWSQKVFYIKRSIIKPLIYLIIILTIATIFPFLNLKFDITISLFIKVAAVICSISLPFILGLISFETVMVQLNKRIKQKE